MDRRSFVQAGLSSLLTYTCTFARARAATTLHGCRMASSGGSFGVTLLGQNKIPQAKLTDLSAFARSTTSRFGLRPGISPTMTLTRLMRLPIPESFFQMVQTAPC